MWGSPERNAQYMARQIYTAGARWLKTVGLAKGRSDAALGLIALNKSNYRGRKMLDNGQYEQVPQEVEEEIFHSELRKLLHGEIGQGSKKKL